MHYTTKETINVPTINAISKQWGANAPLRIGCAAGTRRYYVVAQKCIPYQNCYATGVTAIEPKKIYPMALQCMRQGKGGAVIHSGIKGAKRKYFVGKNWAYNINSSEGPQDETHRFAEIRIKGIWHLLIKPIREKLVPPGQEIKVWYPWKDFTITTYLSVKNRREHKKQNVRLQPKYPNIRTSPRR